MNKVAFHIISLMMLFLSKPLIADSSGDIGEIIAELNYEIDSVVFAGTSQLNRIGKSIKSLELKLFVSESLTNEEKIDLLLQLYQKERLKRSFVTKLETDISKIRYIKGVEIIKILYEKILSLDHHFSSIQTLSEISRMTNPNEYPEFQGFRTNLDRSRDHKTGGFQLTELMQANPLLSVVNSMGTLLISNLSSSQKDAEIKEVECILDFTMRMYGDINTIYFETNFLKSNNDELKKRVEQLFTLYTKPVKYYTDIHSCRMNDDWEQLREKLDAYIQDMSKEEDAELKLEKRINIEFPIDRLLEFIDDYNDYIDLSEKFYQKFYTIMDSYKNEERCSEELPFEYAKLKRDIELSIEKFRVAYKPIEVNGSRLKGILYGINEFN